MKKTCAICLDNIWFNSGKQLRCKHIFHIDCVKKICAYKRQCPMCETYIFDDISDKILTTTNPQKIVELVSQLTNEQLYSLLKEATSKNLHHLEGALINRITNAKDILDEFITTENITVIKKLLSSNKVNCHMTINGQTLIERALTTNNEELINLFLDHCKVPNEPDFMKLTLPSPYTSPYPFFQSQLYPPLTLKPLPLTPTAPLLPFSKPCPPPRPPPPRLYPMLPNING